MSIFNLDLVGGNDSNDGTTYANRWKTFASGATAARTAPGDTIRVMASPDPTSLGMTAAWTQDSKTVTLNSALTADITDCETAWTASTNVTSTADTTTFKLGTHSAKHVIAAGFTTGLASFFATGTLNLSSYKQVSFWCQANAAVAASTLSLRLCSDTAGVTTVDTIAIPALPNSFGQWVTVTVDKGSALGSSIQSIALYCDLDPGAVTVWFDNIIACKDSTAADSLTLTSLLGKIWNLSWVASTTYATNDIRKPTQPNRNGYRYKVTAGGGGSSGSSEPTWPQGIGETVTDGALTWTCEDIEDTWYAIQSISGTTVKLDNAAATLGSAGRGYSGTTETVTTYKREPISSMGANGIVANIQQEAGTATAKYTYSGGWNRTDMSTQTGETWVDLQCGMGTIFAPLNYSTYTNLNGVRANKGIASSGGSDAILTNCHHNNHVTNGIDIQTVATWGSGQGLSACNAGTTGLVYGTTAANFPIRSLRACGSTTFGVRFVGLNHVVPHVDWRVENNGSISVSNSATNGSNFRAYGLITRGTGTGISVGGDVFLFNSSITDTTPISVTSGTDNAVHSIRDGQVADAHLITWEGGTIISATDQRHTASDISWKFRPTSTIRTATRPMRLKVAQVPCAANALVTLTIWARRDSTNVKGKLLVLGGQIAGVGADVSSAAEPSINTWTQYTLTFTPTEAGVVDVHFLVWDGVGTTNNYWVDDFGASQA